jgi:plastocyanin
MITGSRIAAACTLFGAGLIVMAVLAAPAVAASRSVAVEYDQFIPSTITVHVGDTITWTNVDSQDHDVTFASFGSGTLSPGEKYKHTFTKADAFGYRCTIHDTTAKVVVTAPTTPQPTRRPTPRPTRAPTPRPTPSPTPTLSPSAGASPSMSASPTASPTTSATQTSTPTPSSALALSSTSTAPSPAGQATPVADANSPSIVLILVVAIAIAGAVGIGARAARRR